MYLNRTAWCYEKGIHQRQRWDEATNFNPLIAPGQTFEHTFTEAGQYPYYCALHPNMVGTVSVS
jgi:plastocyanin